MIRTFAEMQVETRHNMRGGHGTVTIRHLFSPDEITAKTRLCACLTIPPNSSIGLHRHDGEDELFYIMKGSGELFDGQKTTTVQPGDAILTGKSREHAIANNGLEPLEILAIIMKYAG